MHEASLYEDNCFLTLTYNEENLPEDKSLEIRHVQLFIKKLRDRIKPRKLRMFYCGEYGEEMDRPHYHMIMFNYDFEDKQYFKKNNNGDKIYTSKLLDEIWSYGYCTIGAVTFESAGYCARYTVKKITGEKAQEHYKRQDSEGRDYWLTPEFAHMSRRPGVGKPWLEKWGYEVFPNDFIIVNGVKTKPPKFYTYTFEEQNKDIIEKVKAKRRRDGIKQKMHNTDRRLKTREQVKNAQVGFLKKTL